MEYTEDGKVDLTDDVTNFAFEKASNYLCGGCLKRTRFPSENTGFCCTTHWINIVCRNEYDESSVTAECEYYDQIPFDE